MRPGQIHCRCVGRCLQDGEVSKGLVSQWFSGLGCFSTPKCYECILLPNLLWRTGSITRRDCSTRQRCGQINNQLQQRHNTTGWNDFQEKSGERSQISWIEVQGQRQFRFQKYVKKHREVWNIMSPYPNYQCNRENTYKYTEKMSCLDLDVRQTR